MKETACSVVKCWPSSTMRNRAPQWTARLRRLAAEKELSAADSDLALAETTLKRYQNSYEKKSVSPQEFDEIKARYQAALARRDMARPDRRKRGSIEPGSHVSGLHADSRAVLGRSDREKSRCWHVGVARHADLHP